MSEGAVKHVNTKGVQGKLTLHSLVIMPGLHNTEKLLLIASFLYVPSSNPRLAQWFYFFKPFVQWMIRIL